MAAETKLRGMGALRSWSLAVAVLLGLAACASQPSQVARQSGGQGTITRDQVASDIDDALVALADMHPNLYWRSDPRDILRLKQQLVSQLPETPSTLEVYVTFLRLTAAFNDAHVFVADIPPQLRGADGKSVFDVYSESSAFPATFDPSADVLRVLAVAKDDRLLRPGDEIAAVNGIAARELLAGIEQVLSGGTATKHYIAREEFGAMLWTQGVKAPFRAEVVSPGVAGSRTVMLSGATPAEFSGLMDENGRDPIEYRLLDDGIGLITFRDMTESPDRFAERLVKIFDRVATDHPVGIVVDLRRNNGGNSRLGDLLLAFVNERPYRPFAERRWKVSSTCQHWYEKQDASERRYFQDYLAWPAGQIIVSSQSPTQAPPAVGHRYEGPVAALIGPGTISSGAILADSIKTFHLAMIFGGPISEPANMYGEVCETTLPQTGIRIGAPSALFIRADGDAASTDPVVPDIPVEDDAAGSSVDPVLDAARRWLRSHARTS
jgi:C-terminal processing protease CtpA/Prc